MAKRDKDSAEQDDRTREPGEEPVRGGGARDDVRGIAEEGDEEFEEADDLEDESEEDEGSF